MKWLDWMLLSVHSCSMFSSNLYLSIWHSLITGPNQWVKLFTYPLWTKSYYKFSNQSWVHKLSHLISLTPTHHFNTFPALNHTRQLDTTPMLYQSPQTLFQVANTKLFLLSRRKYHKGSRPRSFLLLPTDLLCCFPMWPRMVSSASCF